MTVEVAEATLNFRHTMLRALAVLFLLLFFPTFSGFSLTMPCHVLFWCLLVFPMAIMAIMIIPNMVFPYLNCFLVVAIEASLFLFRVLSFPLFRCSVIHISVLQNVAIFVQICYQYLAEYLPTTQYLLRGLHGNVGVGC